MELREQTVLITGASRGVGEELARAFAKEGSNVIINYYKSQDKAENLSNELGDKAIALQADIRKSQEVHKMVEEAKQYFKTPITTIVNNALIDFEFNPVTQKNVAELSWADFAKQFEGTIQGALNSVQACLDDMKELGFGRIINIGTNLFQNPVVAYHEYTTAKAALVGLTRNMAKELGAYGITVNMMSGGLLRQTDASKVTSAEVFQIIESSTPLQKVTTPRELADVALFFASPWGRAITGQNLVVDGGLVMD
ncbi:3-oxoacyl-ACP reductase [Ureibacillus sinduriensis]|uniref:3-ketoacyl-ACP reductase n=1 Tax=Ureibacillus sinduriensis BLB-1 = JCM 15800 TaxID=1384057 RepID=A0A0A3IKB6_9BACL|nr:3-oxoacyl-ACP reductase [Ureibacillus sinduriensis]KGR75272.1 3-ketoacyl-ACP reductase [Ureibacillus sinduriensis BLB-1 = JCM 15800]